MKMYKDTKNCYFSMLCQIILKLQKPECVRLTIWWFWVWSFELHCNVVSPPSTWQQIINPLVPTKKCLLWQELKVYLKFRVAARKLRQVGSEYKKQGKTTLSSQKVGRRRQIGVRWCSANANCLSFGRRGRGRSWEIHNSDRLSITSESQSKLNSRVSFSG